MPQRLDRVHVRGFPSGTDSEHNPHHPDGNWESDSVSEEPRELTFEDEAAFWATF
jgi:hypothetical protein